MKPPKNNHIVANDQQTASVIHVSARHRSLFCAARFLSAADHMKLRARPGKQQLAADRLTTSIDVSKPHKEILSSYVKEIDEGIDGDWGSHGNRCPGKRWTQ
ncbi:unnamed protein product [Musa acuminata subsp. malaccensis]|uniref:(wild Malaysian banana) hypothetical protein n=1 Tax=Musa acuminata subsp. malaccensis TaxID=214687 RepID=A0A804J4X9_MUSAM|nr:unnamed protein product [Musa acuminata subsp. malaccensis]